MTEKELNELKEFIIREFPSTFNRYQASWTHRAFNITSRGSVSPEETVKDLKALLSVFASEFPGVWKELEGKKEKEELPVEVEVEPEVAMNHVCPTHKVPLEYKEFTSKKGNFVKMWKCPEKGCDEVEWVGD